MSDPFKADAYSGCFKAIYKYGVTGDIYIYIYIYNRKLIDEQTNNIYIYIYICIYIYIYINKTPRQIIQIFRHV